MKHPLFMGGVGMGLAFGAGLVVLPSFAFLGAAASGPLFVLGVSVGLIYLATKQTPQGRRVDRCRPVRRAAKNAIRPFARVSHG
jgi:hypothetical protein